MTAQARDRVTFLRIMQYLVGGTILFFGFAALVTLPVAIVVGFWIIGNAALTWLGAL
jgi:hypothetical protein